MHTSAAFSGKPFQDKVDEEIQNIRKKDFHNDFEHVADPESIYHFHSGKPRVPANGKESVLDTPGKLSPIWTDEEVQSVEITHKTPQNMLDRVLMNPQTYFTIIPRNIAPCNGIVTFFLAILGCSVCGAHIALRL